MSVAIIDYGSGNLRSAAKAFERAAREASLDVPVHVTADPEVVRKAERIVLPGVGAFGDCKNGLAALEGVIDTLIEQVMDQGKPFLSICVGLQLMATVGREHGTHDGFDWIAGEVVPIKPNDRSLKIPHMGWNDLVFADHHPVFAGIDQGAHAYFVHSYHFAAKNPDHILATVDYGGAITASAGKDNLVGTQFHPEKSQAMGLKLISNFLSWSP